MSERDFPYTLRNGLDVRVRYLLVAQPDGFDLAEVRAVRPNAMPQCECVVDDSELEDIAVAAMADAWGGL